MSDLSTLASASTQAHYAEAETITVLAICCCQRLVLGMQTVWVWWYAHCPLPFHCHSIASQLSIPIELEAQLKCSNSWAHCLLLLHKPTMLRLQQGQPVVPMMFFILTFSSMIWRMCVIWLAIYFWYKYMHWYYTLIVNVRRTLYNISRSQSNQIKTKIRIDVFQFGNPSPLNWFGCDDCPNISQCQLQILFFSDFDGFSFTIIWLLIDFGTHVVLPVIQLSAICL